MTLRNLLASLLVLILGFAAGCDDDTCSPNSLCFKAEAEFFEEIPVVDQIRFVMEGINGNMELDAVPGANRVTVSATRSVRSNTQADAELRLEDLRVVVTSDCEDILIRTEQPENTEGRSYVVDYRVEYPAGLYALVYAVNGDVKAAGARAIVVVRTVNGNLDVGDMQGSMTLVTVNGDIRAEATITSDEDVRLQAINGNLALTVPPETSAQVSARVTNGLISVTGLDLADLVRTDTSLSGRLEGGAGRIALETTNGNIALRGR